MTTFAGLQAVAMKYVGYVEGGGPDGKSGNLTQFWSRLDPSLQGQPWCSVFISAVFREAGCPLPAIDRTYGYINAGSAMNWAKSHNYWDESGHYSPGDAAIYGDGSHTGLIFADNGIVMSVCEGNTSPDIQGSQTNGGGVYIRSRAHNSWVNGAVKFSRLLTAVDSNQSPLPIVLPTPSVGVHSYPFPLPGNHWYGPLSADPRNHSGYWPADRPAIMLIQKLVGAGVDGGFGLLTKASVSRWQATHHLLPDGLFGAISWAMSGLRI